MTAGALAPAADGADGALDTLPGTLAIDARAVHASGIGRYLRELLDHWLREPPFERLVLLGDPTALAPWRDAPGAPRVDVVPHQGGFYAAAARSCAGRPRSRYTSRALRRMRTIIAR